MENLIWGLMNIFLFLKNNKQCLLVAVFVCMCWGWAHNVYAQSYRIIAYNVENLFDCQDDSLTRDEEYLPTSMRAWNLKRYQHKLVAVGKVLSAMGEWDTPLLIGLCEVENRHCLEDLCNKGPLRAYGYHMVHYESPDRRGIDVALLYNPHQFHLLKSSPIPVGQNAKTPFTTRDILYAKGVVEGRDTLHVYMCHFPSRWSGKMESEHLRMEAASVLRTHADSVLGANPEAFIVMMGDFNDTPSDKSMRNSLGALPCDSLRTNGVFYNLMFPFVSQNKGTHYYQGQWNCYDQFVVSRALLNKHHSLHVSEERGHIFAPDFLLTDDEKFFQRRPWRTYNGMKYWGGFSDHLPIFIDLTRIP